MNIDKLQQMSEDLVYKHLSKEWKVTLSKKMTSCAGFCCYWKKEIKISIPISTYHSEEEVTDTILHEVTHALVGPSHNHDKVWKAKAIEIGSSGRRTYGQQPRELQRRSKHTYYYKCPHCGKISVKHRRLKEGTSCGKCDKRWNPDYILDLIDENHYN